MEGWWAGWNCQSFRIAVARSSDWLPDAMLHPSARAFSLVGFAFEWTSALAD